ncbi:hypothetical protein BZA05DRAFT_404436, partial [Tricharina praecox]|uniref:uncharacterized protein n=1 Tax=Tricharina praecox TaxID=43433 RepID=UPI0022203997
MRFELVGLPRDARSWQPASSSQQPHTTHDTTHDTCSTNLLIPPSRPRPIPHPTSSGVHRSVRLPSAAILLPDPDMSDELIVLFSTVTVRTPLACGYARFLPYFLLIFPFFFPFSFFFFYCRLHSARRLCVRVCACVRVGIGLGWGVFSFFLWRTNVFRQFFWCLLFFWFLCFSFLFRFHFCLRDRTDWTGRGGFL